MRWENVGDLFGLKRKEIRDEVKLIDARTLSEREEGWIRDILHASPEWHDSDITNTKVVAEGPNAEGYSMVLQAPQPENPLLRSSRDIVGQLWIETDDQCTINIQLFQWEGRLQEIYSQIIGSNGHNRTLPETWKEVSREAVSG